MANRSKKVVLSARIDPYLKAGIELAASSSREKIVAFLEYCIRNGMSSIAVNNPFVEADVKVPFEMFFSSVWSDDEVLYKLRVGCLGPEYADRTLVEVGLIVVAEKHFAGDYDLYGDLNGNAAKLGYKAKRIMIDLEKVRMEWDVINEYAEFRIKNGRINVSYDKYLEIAYQKPIPF
ncbi:TPA: hypothetical protein OT881_005845 [Pseudomonas aeruginosa]|nr:hypothetical protein [Pseudomonas aeruginosa]